MTTKEISPERYALARLGRYKLELAIATFWSIVFVMVPMQIPLLTGFIVDGVLGKQISVFGITRIGPSPSLILGYSAIGLIAVAGLYGLSSFLRTITVAKVSRHFVFDLEKELVKKYESLSLDMHNKFGSGELLNRAILDTNMVRPFIESSIIKLPTNVVRMAYPIIMVFLINPYLATIACSALVLQHVVTHRLQRNLRSAARDAREDEVELTTVLKENLDGMETIQTSTAEEHLTKRIFGKIEALESDQLRTQKYSGLVSGAVWALTSLGLGLVWWQGGLEILNGSMSVGALVAFTGFVFYIYAPSRRFTDIINVYHTSIVSVERIQEVLDTSPTIVDDPRAPDLEIGAGSIEFQDVSFSYGDFETQVLNDVSLQIGPKSLTAVVGRSGSGKSTILKLISRLYEPSSGRVLIDGQEVRRARLASLRSQLAVVPQTPMIFTGSVADNIRLGKPGATDTEVWEACEDADAIDFIRKLENGLDTLLGKGGANLSGGQVQRIAIARALLRKPKILLLDEPSSALDSKSESAIMATLGRLRKKMTIVLVGHHLRAMSGADNIVVMDSGKLVEQGRHVELISSNGLYSVLCRAGSTIGDGGEDATD